MALTPVEIRHVKPTKAIVGGYKRSAVDELLDQIVLSFEDVWRERADLADKVDQLEDDLVRYRELEALLRTTLVSAEKAAVTLKEQARKEADLIVEEARAEARSITRLARSDHALGSTRRCDRRFRPQRQGQDRRAGRPRSQPDRATAGIVDGAGTRMTSVNTSRFREALLEERQRVTAAIQNLHE